MYSFFEKFKYTLIGSSLFLLNLNLLFFNFRNIYKYTLLLINLPILYLFSLNYKEISLKIIDNILEIKHTANEIILNFLYGNEFLFVSCYLYTDLTTKYDVSVYFRNSTLSKVDSDLILELYKRWNIYFIDNKNIRLKFIFYYKRKQFILYFPYNETLVLENNYSLKKKNKNYIPYPPYSSTILENYRKDIILPIYTEDKNNKKKVLYNLFNIESKNILTIEINNIENKLLLNYFNMIKTPFNDFGLLYNCPVKLIWILYENNINVNSFSDFYLEYFEQIFNEENMTLDKHFIKMNSSDINENIISNHMKQILIKKNI